MTDAAARRRAITWRTRGANFLGAVLAWVYFRFVDPVTSDPGVTWREIVFFVAVFTAMTLIGTRLTTRWSAPLLEPGSPEARRRALLFPWVIAGISLANWMAAGIIFGVMGPLLAGWFTVAAAVRTVIGITAIGGVVTTAVVFFSVEDRWRRELPGFFPAGDLSAVPRVPRLPVRARLLVVFVLTSLGPLLLLGLVVWRRGQAAAGDPARAAAILVEMLAIIAFLVVAGLVAAIRLSLVVSDSVASPLLGLTFAMARVERGDLDAKCPVVSNDEIGAATEGFNRMLDGLREREAIKETFGRYVTREIRDEILAGRVSFEGEQRDVTMLFSDLREFTPWVESTEPRAVVRDLNAYFAEMEAAIRAHGGLVLQFIGDEIEAVFGAPVPAADHAARAVAAALEMRARLAAWNDGRGHPLRHGIGVHTGSVLAGAIGSRERLSYALVGDTVNLASRIQNLTKDAGTDILVSGTTARRLDGLVALSPLPAVRVKGKSTEVEVFRVGSEGVR
jgi:class 3 adenylate cyclase